VDTDVRLRQLQKGFCLLLIGSNSSEGEKWNFLLPAPFELTRLSELLKHRNGPVLQPVHSLLLYHFPPGVLHIYYVRMFLESLTAEPVLTDFDLYLDDVFGEHHPDPAWAQRRMIKAHPLQPRKPRG